MNVVLDTNVFISGVFFSGPPYHILQAWRDQRLGLVVSLELLKEYREVAQRLAQRYGNIDITEFMELATVASHLIDAPPLGQPVCDDPQDDMLFACAVASRTKIIVSGDKHVLDASGYRGVTVLRPRAFVDRYL